MNNFKKGFTLIELLVVIAIIGILATVVLASLGTARTRATDAKVKVQISNARTQAEIYAGGNGGSFDGVCSDPGMEAIIIALSGPNCQADSGAWTLSAALSENGYFCADSAGASRKTESHPNSLVCPPLVP